VLRQNRRPFLDALASQALRRVTDSGVENFQTDILHYVRADKCLWDFWILDFWTVLDFWIFGFLDFWTVLDFWTFGFSDSFGLLDFCIFGLLDSFGLLDFWIFGLLDSFKLLDSF
jgi:hypothetical protein